MMDALTYRYSNMSLGIPLLLCPFSGSEPPKVWVSSHEMGFDSFFFKGLVTPVSFVHCCSSVTCRRVTLMGGRVYCVILMITSSLW